MLKGSPYMLNSDHKPIARAAPIEKENEKPSKAADEKINLFSQQTASTSASKPDYMQIGKYDTRKRGPMSSATSAST